MLVFHYCLPARSPARYHPNHVLRIYLQELFKRVIPHQCLGAVWSRRDKSRDRDAASVVATVEQFNAVSYRVISTVLMSVEAKPQHRAKTIVKWIDIAQVK